ncbi:dihydrodipicolinate synthase family protein [Arenibacter sp. BSSL-BM3]|uniref:Dihydrodipicolinate synthase family protein n=1 Tax=Arenibacter arenosicollis TaxID=2762274 RepID=A0ABR7QMV1_9FLAO|nr:dihydrodipicolinate synthase family protein [Arenibacter arenosicollis]MBC8768364.1 dihydrodipicolinate synthase family protein [Arenibacter arenosicollis]
MNGLIAATYAPLHNDSSINLEIISTYGQFLKNNKVKGAFVNGSTGDFVSLTTKERKEIITEWSKNKPNDFFLVNHVGHNSLKEAKDLATHSSDKVDAIAALAPYYFRLSSLKSLLEYCKEIAGCAPDTPFYYYHIPVLTGANFLMHEFLELASKEIPNFAGIKFTNNNLIDYKYCKDFNNGAYNILFGFDEILLASLPLGAEGWVGSTYNHLAPLYLSIIEAFHNNDHKLAAALQEKSMKFVDILNAKGGFNGAAKSFMKVLGVDCGPSRFPHVTLSPKELEEAKTTLEALGIMDHASQ